MSYDDPIESIASGTVKGGLEWTSEFIKSLINKFKDGKLAFIQDEETIKLVKEQYNAGELSFYKKYISDKELLFMVKMGLTLRKLENNLERKQNLRGKLLIKYDVKGLHIAQFVENGLLNRYTGILIDNLTSVEDFKDKILRVLNNIEKYVLFVQTTDNERNVIHSASTVIASHSPSIFIISGISSAAKTVRKCEEKLKELLKNYDLEKISSGEKENFFFKRNP